MSRKFNERELAILAKWDERNEPTKAELDLLYARIYVAMQEVMTHLPVGLCWCGKYHYTCHDCAKDCTVGAPAGPATTDTRGVTRCCECHRDWARRCAAVTPYSEDELRAVRVALSQIADDGDPDPVEPADRKLATELLVRLANA